MHNTQLDEINNMVEKGKSFKESVDKDNFHTINHTFLKNPKFATNCRALNQLSAKNKIINEKS